MTARERRAQRSARELLKRFAIDSPDEIKIREIALVSGLYVQERDIRGAEGRLVRSGDKHIATVNKSIAYEGKKRFVAAHEFGHFRLHSDVDIFVCTDADFIDWHRKRPQETEANVFAAELLMPSDLFVEAARGHRPSIETIRHLAEAFRVTRSAAAIRYLKLEVVPCAVVFCRDGMIEWYFCSERMQFQYIRIRRPVHEDTGAAEFFRQDDVIPGPAETPVASWFIDFSQNPGASCMEDYMPIPSINATLSLIWME